MTKTKKGPDVSRHPGPLLSGLHPGACEAEGINAQAVRAGSAAIKAAHEHEGDGAKQQRDDRGEQDGEVVGELGGALIG